jgi:hypothetical protein
MTTRLPAVQFHEIWYRKTSVVDRIPIDYAVLNPDPYWECGSESRRMETDQNKPNSQPFKKAFGVGLLPTVEDRA